MNPEQGEGHGFTGTDDKWHEFHFDLNAICAWEAKSGKTIGFLSKAEDDPAIVGFSDLRSLIWAGLLHERNRSGKGATSRATPESIGSLVPNGEHKPIFRECILALRAAIKNDSSDNDDDEGADEGEADGDRSEQ